MLFCSMIDWKKTAEWKNNRVMFSRYNLTVLDIFFLRQFEQLGNRVERVYRVFVSSRDVRPARASYRLEVGETQ